MLVQNKQHLLDLIQDNIYIRGHDCSLNHLDISKLTDLSGVFRKSAFNGDISKWETSQVMDMHSMFYRSEFNGDISKWDVTRV